MLNNTFFFINYTTLTFFIICNFIQYFLFAIFSFFSVSSGSIENHDINCVVSNIKNNYKYFYSPLVIHHLTAAWINSIKRKKLLKWKLKNQEWFAWVIKIFCIFLIYFPEKCKGIFSRFLLKRKQNQGNIFLFFFLLILIYLPIIH